MVCVCAAQEVICAVQEVCVPRRRCFVVCVRRAGGNMCRAGGMCATQEVFCGVCSAQEVICAVQEVCVPRRRCFVVCVPRRR